MPKSLTSPVDLVLVNAKIWTENPAQPEAEALAVSGSRILAVGDSDSIRSMAGAGTDVIDARGRRVVPAFKVAHAHYVEGNALTSANLTSLITHEMASASGEEEDKRSLAPGNLADMVVLSGDIFSIDPVEIRNVKVDLRVFNGKVVS